MAPPDRPDRDRLIVALDVDSLAQAERLAERLDGLVRRFKIGSQLFTAGGPAVVEAIQKRGAEVFLDLKFHDIPNTVAGAAREAARLGVFMFNVHASGGLRHDEGGRRRRRGGGEGAVRAAAARDRGHRAHEPRPRRAAPRARRRLVGRRPRAAPLPSSPARRGSTARVASPVEIAAIRRSLGAAWVIVTPGVRPAGSAAGDQSRVATPGAAARAGAHYLVVGRPITARARSRRGRGGHPRGDGP